MIANAEGDASRFKQVLTEYQKAPAVTRDRMYLETMQQIFANTTKVMVNSKTGNNLISLPLDKLIAQSVANDTNAKGSVTVQAPADVNPAADPPAKSGIATPARCAQPAIPRSGDTLMNRIISYLIAVAIVVWVVSSSLFVVDQRQYAILFALGEVKEVISDPGLHVKLPPPFQNVLFLDKQILTLETPETDRFITAEKMNILVDAFVKWRISQAETLFCQFRRRRTSRARPHVADHQGSAER